MTLYEKVLMRRTIPGACKDVNDKQSARYRVRQSVAHNMELNFRFGGYPVGKHSMINMRRKYPDAWHSGKCLCCGLPAHSCICKIEIKDLSGNISFLEV